MIFSKSFTIESFIFTTVGWSKIVAVAVHDEGVLFSLAVE